MEPTKALRRAYGEAFNFVLVYVIECVSWSRPFPCLPVTCLLAHPDSSAGSKPRSRSPHPLAPDLSPYSGAIWELGYSKFRQARSFGERLNYARNVSTEGAFDVKLADGLIARRGGPNNGLWCAWGPAPNAAWLIAPNGTVLLAQSWFNASELGQEMNATLAAER